MQAEVNEEQTEIEDIARRVTDNQPAAVSYTHLTLPTKA